LTASFGLARVVVRLSLGGVAGIIIGGFWSPSGMPAAELARGTSVPLALAFVTGYGIDVLLSLLERAKTAVSASPDAYRR